MKRLIGVVIVIIIMSALVFAGCSAAAQSSYSYGSDSEAAGAPEVAKDSNTQPAPAASSVAEEGISAGVTGDTGIDAGSILQPGVDRKVIYTGNIEAKTKNFDDDYNKIMSSLKADGGYVQSSSITGTKPETWEDAGRDAVMVLRVKSDKFDSFIEMLKGIGKNMSTSTSGEDISVQYYDTEQQLDTLRTRQGRLQEMMKNPNYPLVDLIQVEKELSDVSLQIQQLETTQRDYDSLIDYSIVNITLHETNPIEVKSVSAPEEDLGTQISNGFFGVLNVLADIGRGILIFITAGSPALAIIAVIVIVIVLLVKHSQKKNRKKGGYPPYPPQQGGQNNGQNNVL
jgi:hypothetical protein